MCSTVMLYHSIELAPSPNGVGTSHSYCCTSMRWGCGKVYENTRFGCRSLLSTWILYNERGAILTRPSQGTAGANFFGISFHLCAPRPYVALLIRAGAACVGKIARPLWWIPVTTQSQWAFLYVVLTVFQWHFRWHFNGPRDSNRDNFQCLSWQSQLQSQI